MVPGMMTGLSTEKRTKSEASGGWKRMEEDGGGGRKMKKKEGDGEGRGG